MREGGDTKVELVLWVMLSGLGDRILKSRAERLGVLVGVGPPTVSAGTHFTRTERPWGDEVGGEVRVWGGGRGW